MLPGGARLWVKRDDLTGLGMGGNKARKLELLCGAAQADGADTLITVGAGQSNHCRMTAAAGARLGWPVHLVLGGDAPAEPAGQPAPVEPLRRRAALRRGHGLGCPRGREGRPGRGAAGSREAALRHPYRRQHARRRGRLRRGVRRAAAPVRGGRSCGRERSCTPARAVGRTPGCWPVEPRWRRPGGAVPEIVAFGVAKGILVDPAYTAELADATLDQLGLTDVRVAAGDVHLDGAALGADYAQPTPEADAALGVGRPDRRLGARPGLHRQGVRRAAGHGRGRPLAGGRRRRLLAHRAVSPRSSPRAGCRTTSADQRQSVR